MVPVGFLPRVLLVTSDFAASEMLCRQLAQAAIEVEVCPDMALASSKLCKSKFDGLIIDFQIVAPATKLLAKVHSMTSNRRAVVLAVVGTSADIQTAFRAGANFVLERPLCAKVVARTLNAAYPLLMREKRRYYRCPVSVPVQITTGNAQAFEAVTLNISEGGMAIKADCVLHVGSQLKVAFFLFGMVEAISCSAEVCWQDNSCRVGLQFLEFYSSALDRLQAWLVRRQGSMTESTLTAEHI